MQPTKKALDLTQVNPEYPTVQVCKERQSHALIMHILVFSLYVLAQCPDIGIL